jgi:hypothetical protein
MRRDERSFEGGDEVWEGGRCGFDILGGQRFDLDVTGWVGEEGVKLFDRLKEYLSV